MELNKQGFEKTEATLIGEKIQEKRKTKKSLELELDLEKFNYRNINRTREVSSRDLTISTGFIAVPLSVVASVGIVLVINGIYNIMNSEKGGINFDMVGISIGIVITLVFGTLAVRVWLEQIKKARMLSEEMGKKDDLNRQLSYKEQEELSKKKIQALINRIDDLDKEITALILKEKEKDKIVLQKSLEEQENNNRDNETLGKFKIKADTYSTVQKEEQNKYYDEEIKKLQDKISELNKELVILNKKKDKIVEDFKIIRGRFIGIGVLFIILFVARLFFEGKALIFTAFFGYVGVLIFVLYVAVGCREPIVLYLLETESHLVDGYAFCNNIEPVYVRKKAIQEEIEECERSIKKYYQYKLELQEL